MFLTSASPASLFRSHLTKGRFYQLFQDFIIDGAAVGRDGTRVEAFEKRFDAEIDIVLRKIKAGTYEFTSYREKLISKGAGKNPRQISIPTVRDKLVLKFLSELLTEIYPNHVSKPPHEIVKEIHSVSSGVSDEHRYLRLDIQGYYPSIDHVILMRILKKKIRLPEFLNLIENAIKTPTGKKKIIENFSKCGVPQGLSISNILSSLYLEVIDHEYEKVPDVEYYRFVDDILIIADQKITDGLANDLPSILERERKITCHKVGEGNKSTLVSVKDGVDYLGYHFCQKKIEVRTSSYKKMFSNLMKLFTVAKYKGNQATLIWRMNLRITGCRFLGKRIGWLFFFSQSENMQQLKQLDAFVTTQTVKFLEKENGDKIKKFVRAYHEIRFNHRDSKYFLDFDDFTDDRKKAEIKLLMSFRVPPNLDKLSSEDLNKLFNKCISREIGDLERDMLEVFS